MFAAMEGNTCTRLFADQVQIDHCKRKIDYSKEVFTGLANVLALAGNEVRLKIVYLLEEEKELCPCDLADILDMSNPAISQHLKKLKEANIVNNRKVGQLIYYSLTEEHFQVLKPFFKHINEQTEQAIAP